MRFALSLTALAAVAVASPAAPSPQSARAAGLSLIKTSEAEPARWVTDEEKELLGSKRIGFFDITDIHDEEVLDILSTPPEEIKAKRNNGAVTYPDAVFHKARAQCLIDKVTTDGPKVWLRDMTNIWNRHYRSVNGTYSAGWMFDLVKSVAAANPLIQVKQFTHAGFNQPSVIATIPGDTSDLVIVGAHYDSTGGSTSARGPGADDNGSGVVVILEALRVFALSRYKTQNTLEFQFYGGEEGGLLGSKDIFAKYKADKKSVLAFVNQDMAGYSPSGRISIFTDYVDAGLTAYCVLITNEYIGEAPTSDVCGYACSDHGSAYSNGFPAAYVCDEVIETSSPYIHSPRDTYETIMWDAILRHSIFTVAFLVEASYL